MLNISAIKKAVSLNSSAFDAVKSRIHEGNTEKDIERLILETWKNAGGKCVDRPGDIVSGERSAAIEGDATERKLSCGDTLILDLQPSIDGVFADTTRTFFVGGISEEQKKAYEAVIFALTETEKVLFPGICACEIYEAMQNALRKKGFSCPHHAGHAVGDEKLMEPEFLPEKKEKLSSGMTVAIEPGIYLDNFGIRVENNYLITENGCENLSYYPTDADYFIL